MILDDLLNAHQYDGLHSRFATAIEFLQNKVPYLDLGRYELDGDNLFVTIVEVDLRSESQSKLEVHDNYIDVQVLVKGTETYGYALRRNCNQPLGEIDPSKDILFFNDPKQTLFTVKAGQFMIFYPSDAHAPLIGNGKVVKAIAKVRI